MVSLGKVTAPKPVNLPSQKKENNGNDPSINLISKSSAHWSDTPPPPSGPSPGAGADALDRNESSSLSKVPPRVIPAQPGPAWGGLGLPEERQRITEEAEREPYPRLGAPSPYHQERPRSPDPSPPRHNHRDYDFNRGGGAERYYYNRPPPQRYQPQPRDDRGVPYYEQTPYHHYQPHHENGQARPRYAAQQPLPHNHYHSDHSEEAPPPPFHYTNRTSKPTPPSQAAPPQPQYFERGGGHPYETAVFEDGDYNHALPPPPPPPRRLSVGMDQDGGASETGRSEISWKATMGSSVHQSDIASVTDDFVAVRQPSVTTPRKILRREVPVVDNNNGSSSSTSGAQLEEHMRSLTISSEEVDLPSEASLFHHISQAEATPPPVIMTFPTPSPVHQQASVLSSQPPPPPPVAVFGGITLPSTIDGSVEGPPAGDDSSRRVPRGRGRSRGGGHHGKGRGAPPPPSVTPPPPPPPPPGATNVVSVSERMGSETRIREGRSSVADVVVGDGTPPPGLAPPSTGRKKVGGGGGGERRGDFAPPPPPPPPGLQSSGDRASTIAEAELNAPDSTEKKKRPRGGGKKRGTRGSGKGQQAAGAPPPSAAVVTSSTTVRHENGAPTPEKEDTKDKAKRRPRAPKAGGKGKIIESADSPNC